MRDGELRSAIDLLRGAVERHPDDPALPLLLARSYMLDANLFWAETTLRAAIDRQPGNSELPAWLALVNLREGDPDLARESLSSIPEPEGGPGRTRWLLLSAYRASLSGEDHAAQTAFAAIGADATAFPEDRPVRTVLRRRIEPWWAPPVTGELELGGGATSNALAGSPTDPGASGTSSGLLDGKLRLRIAPALSTPIRPVLDLDGDFHYIADEAYSELSSQEGSARLGVFVIRDRYRLLGGFRAEALNLDQTPTRFSDARRLELELESAKGWVVFGGGGHRDYRDDRRTRDEWDLGGGGPLRLWSGRSIALGATLRGASANSPAYDLRGASLAAATRFALPARLTARLSGTASWDDYPHSGGLEGLLVFGTDEKRRDLTGKLNIQLWRPAARTLSVGLEGEVARRDSTADERTGFDYDYTEYRVAVRLRFGFSADPSGPRVVRVPGHVPLEWGLGPGEASEAERIMELLRQDEDLRRGSSCGT